MSNFCPKCNNLLVPYLTTTVFNYHCVPCNLTIDIKPEDTRLVLFQIVNQSSIVPHLLEQLPHDPLNPKVKKNCPKCTFEFAKQIRVGANMQAINACLKCYHQWSESV